MSKKRNFVLFGLISAVLGGSVIAASRLYDLSVVPSQKTPEEIDKDPMDSVSREWFNKIEGKEDVYARSIDDLNLHATYIRAKEESHKYAICIHGIRSNGEFMSFFGKHYHEMGINVLLPDLRGFGKSDGNYIGYGYFDRLDIIEWIYWIIKKDPDAHILLHGSSMGAATTLMTTGEHLPSQVIMAVSDSSYSTLSKEFADVYKKNIGGWMPTGLALFIIKILVKLRCGYDIDKVNVLDAVARSKTPTLFIHGDEDTVIDPQMCAHLYEKCAAPKQYCLILGSDHVQGAITDPDKYWKKVESLMEKTSF